MSEPHTHYDGNDGHGYAMHDVLDPPELNDLVDHMERQNIVIIKGDRYYIKELMAGPFVDGAYYAKLEPVRDVEIVPLADTLDLSEVPF